MFFLHFQPAKYHTISNPLTNPNCPTTPRPNNPRQQLMRHCQLGIILHRMIQMLQLLIPNAPYLPHQTRQLLPHLHTLRLHPLHHLQQRSDLLIIMTSYLRLHSLRTRHRGLATQ